jgi:hypothetical protein
MQPKRFLTLHSISLGNKTITADEVVWVIKQSMDSCEIEYKGLCGIVSNSALTEYPVPRPSVDKLREHDLCFGLSESAFTTEHIDADLYFSIIRCKAHGRRFLVDVRGGIAMYEVTTLLEDDDDGSPREIWSKYRSMSVSWLFLKGRTL